MRSNVCVCVCDASKVMLTFFQLCVNDYFPTGWVTVYMGLEQAAKTLAKNIADETVHVVKHK